MAHDEARECLSREEIELFLNGDANESRMDEIDQHLSRCGECFRLLEHIDRESFVPQPDLSETLPLVEDEPEVSGQVASDDMLPQFQEVILRERIGQGGFGDVYLAEQCNADHRPVAFKVLHRKFSSSRSETLLRQEVSALTRIQHENVARIYQTCTADDGTVGIVMEYVEGETLIESAPRQGLSMQDRLEIAGQICDAVQHIHDRGIVHRDLTTKNILLRKESDEYTAKVIDFGLSLFSNRAHLRLLRSAGTLPFMAPEQTGHRQDGVSVRTDIYALGLCLFELLAGLKACPRLNGESTNAFLDRKFSYTFRLPSLASGLSQRELGRSQLLELDRILRKATAVAPEDRYESARAVLADLQAVRLRRPTTLRSKDRIHRSSLFVRRNRIAIVATSAFLILAVGAIWLLISQQEKTDRAVEDLASLSTELSESVDPWLTPASPSATDEQAIELATEVGERTENSDNRDADTVLQGRVSAANALISLGAFQEAIPKLEAIVEDVEKRFGDDNDDSVAIRLHLARAYAGAGQLSRAKEIYNQSVAIWRDRYGESDVRTLTAMSYVATTEQAERKYTDAIATIDKILRLRDEHGVAADVYLGMMYRIRGQSYHATKNFQQASADFRAARKSLVTSGVASTNPVVFQVESDLALAQARQGECEEAAELIARVMIKAEGAYPMGAIDIDKLRMNQSTILFLCGRMDEATQIAETVLATTRHEAMREHAAKELKGYEIRSSQGTTAGD